jgi:extracellular factor (EF) 3-hydroxypalmitic acid methyl ester biosynthesis protein
MDQEAIKINAHLVSGERTIPIDAGYTSKYSLLIRFLNGDHFQSGTEFNKLVIEVDDENVELGPCRLIPELNIDGYAGRLIFTRDVYDLESLFFDHKVVKLQTAFVNLPLVLGHKNSIRQSFKDFTANLTYDLNVYKHLFDKLDAEYHEEPNHIRSLVQRAIIETEGRKLMRFLDEQLVKFEQLVGGFGKEEHERHGFYFRKQLWNIILCSEFMARTNLKPRGYSGDSEMMAMIYRNEFKGAGTFAKVLNKHPLEHPAAQAVRNRRELVTQRLLAVQGAHGEDKLTVLSVACGPAFELQDILCSEKICGQYHFTLLDQDRYALFEAAKLVDHIEKSLGCRVSVDYLNDSVRTMLATPQLKRKWGEFQFIYSMGLFDYLTPPVARAVIKKLYQLLIPGGELVVGNFHASNPSRYYMEYWLDWVLYYRTEEEFCELMKDAPEAQLEVSFEETGTQMFLHVRKPEK